MDVAPNTERHLAAIVEHSPDAVVSMDDGGRIVAWNRNAELLLGWQRDEMVGHVFEDRVIPASQRSHYERRRARAVSAGAAKGSPAWFTLPARCKDGGERPVELALVVLSDAAASGVIAFMRHDSQGQDAAELFRLAVEASPAGIVLTDETGHISLVNGQVEASLGWRRDELIGQPIEVLVPDRARERHVHERAAYGAFPERRPMGARRILLARRKDGTECAVEIGLNPIATPHGVRVLAVLVDLSEKQLAASRAERTQRKLDRANLDLDQFAYIASHDLRAPLRAIANLASWIVEDLGADTPPTVASHVSRLKGRITRMERLIDGLLEFARAGRTAAESTSVDTAELTRNAVALLGPRDGMATVVDGSLPVIVAPGVRIEQVIRNLLDNAYKHHDRDEGKVVVGCRERPECFEFYVADDGPGIPAEHHERVFQPFQTLRPRDDVEGSGLGLALVRKILESHGGRIWVDPAEGRGTTFRFTWPKSAPETVQ